MKVAVYCRVSTDQDDQIHSFESQQRYFRDYIDRQAGWELYAVYADEGVTGTSTKKRAGFNRMICDARQKRFDLILTKEISRFARNTLDSIYYIRELKRIGIGVLFMNDNLHTLQEDSELLLTIKATMAQEESRATSSRVKWGQMRRMEQGVVFGHSLLGYDVKDGRMTVNPAGAEVVRLIFHKYVRERKGTTVIARELREAGVPTPSGGKAWRNTVVLKILKNEKYCGDLKQKKTITPDFLTHRKQYNHGEEPFVFLQNHHEPIVDRALWEAAQREIARRDADGKCGAGHGNRYPLSGKIKCGVCQKSFVSRERRRRDGSRYKTWRCRTAVSGAGCAVGFQLRDAVGMDMIRQSVSMLRIDAESVLRDVVRVVRESRDDQQAQEEKRRKAREELEKKKIRVLDAFLAGQISEDDLRLMRETYEAQLAALQAREPALEDVQTEESRLRAAIDAIVNDQMGSDGLYGALLEQMVVYPDRRVEVRLKDLSARWVFSLARAAR